MAETLLDALNPTILIWARENADLTREEVAQRLNQPVEVIVAWEQGEKGPTGKQARTLAKIYRRHFLEFVRTSEPPVRRLPNVADFRLNTDAPDPRVTPEYRALMDWVDSVRVNAIELYEELDAQVPVFNAELRTSLSTDPEGFGESARNTIGFSIQEQRDLTSSQQYLLPTMLREWIESAGVLVLKTNDIG